MWLVIFTYNDSNTTRRKKRKVNRPNFKTYNWNIICRTHLGCRTEMMKWCSCKCMLLATCEFMNTLLSCLWVWDGRWAYLICLFESHFFIAAELCMHLLSVIALSLLHWSISACCLFWKTMQMTKKYFQLYEAGSFFFPWETTWAEDQVGFAIQSDSQLDL